MMTANEAMSVLAAVGATHITEGRMSSDLVYWSRGIARGKVVRLHDHEDCTLVMVGGYLAVVDGSDPGAVEWQVRRLLEVA